MHMFLYVPCYPGARDSASDDSDDERLRGDDDKETELMEELATAQAMEPKSDVSTHFSCRGQGNRLRLWRVTHASWRRVTTGSGW